MVFCATPRSTLDEQILPHPKWIKKDEFYLSRRGHHSRLVTSRLPLHLILRWPINSLRIFSWLLCNSLATCPKFQESHKKSKYTSKLRSSFSWIFPVFGMIRWGGISVLRPFHSTFFTPWDRRSRSSRPSRPSPSASICKRPQITCFDPYGCVWEDGDLKARSCQWMSISVFFVCQGRPGVVLFVSFQYLKPLL